MAVAQERFEVYKRMPLIPLYGAGIESNEVGKPAEEDARERNPQGTVQQPIYDPVFRCRSGAEVQIFLIVFFIILGMGKQEPYGIGVPLKRAAFAARNVFQDQSAGKG